MPQVVVDFVANTRGLQRGMDQAGNASSGFASKLKGVAKMGALGAGAAGVGALVATLKIGFDEFQQGQQVAAQTAAVLKSTGEAAHVSAGHVADLAGQLMKKSGVDDEAIASGENLLLTFTNVRNEAGKGNDIFDQTTKIALDMSVALGTDMKGSALQLGKALNDPIKGVGALSRVGVSFTKQQKEQIKALVESGKTLDAQKIILAEVNKEFGGSAEAAGKTLPGQINVLKESFNNFAGDLVARLVPALGASIGWLREHWPEIQQVIQQTWDTIRPLIAAFAELVVAVVTTVRDNWDTIGPIVERVAGILQTAVRIMTDALRLVVALIHGDWSEAWNQLKTLVSDALQQVSNVLGLGTALVSLIVRAAKAIGTAILNAVVNALASIGDDAWNKIKGIGTTITGFLDTIKNWGESIATSIKNAAVNTLVGIGSDAWDKIKAIGTFLAGVVGTVKGWGSDVGNWIKDAVVSAIVGIGSAAWEKIQNIGSFLAGVVGTIKGWGTDVGNWVKDAIPAAIVGIGADVWAKLQGIGSFLSGVKNTILGWGSDIGGWIRDGVTSVFSGIGTELANTIRGALNVVIRAWNSLETPGFTIPGPGPLPDINFPSVGFPNLPELARGAVISQPMLALLGEGSGREIVSPESLLRSIVAESRDDVHVRVFIGDQELKGLVRTEVSHSNAGIARALIAGSV